jgi:hypothetical protein
VRQHKPGQLLAGVRRGHSHDSGNPVGDSCRQQSYGGCRSRSLHTKRGPTKPAKRKRTIKRQRKSAIERTRSVIRAERRASVAVSCGGNSVSSGHGSWRASRCRWDSGSACRGGPQRQDVGGAGRIEAPDRGLLGRPAQGSVAPRKSSSGSDGQVKFTGQGWRPAHSSCTTREKRQCRSDFQAAHLSVTLMMYEKCLCRSDFLHRARIFVFVY